MFEEYKSGQFVSICGKLHRVKKAKPEIYTCRQCQYDKSPYIRTKLGKEVACDDCVGKLMYGQYPVKITKVKPKRQG